MAIIHDCDPELVVAVKLRQSELEAQQTLLERLLDERDELLAALDPFVDAANELTEDQVYKNAIPGECSIRRERNRVICAVGSVDLKARHFAHALEVVTKATRPAKPPKKATEVPA